MRWRLRLLLLGFSLGASAGCGAGSATATPTTQVATYSSPAGAAAGFLTAAATGTGAAWIAPGNDSKHLAEIGQMELALGIRAPLFWELSDTHVVSVHQLDDSHATVTLSKQLVWCLGAGPSDPTATCTAPSGIGPNMYSAVRIGGKWYMDIDIDKGVGLRANPAVTSSP